MAEKIENETISADKYVSYRRLQFFLEKLHEIFITTLDLEGTATTINADRVAAEHAKEAAEQAKTEIFEAIGDFGAKTQIIIHTWGVDD